VAQLFSLGVSISPHDNNKTTMKTIALIAVLILSVQSASYSQESKTDQASPANATNSPTAHIDKIPIQFVGKWIENNTNDLHDQLSIQQDQLVWNRTDKTDKLNYGDHIVKLDEMELVSPDGVVSLRFPVKYKKEIVLNGQSFTMESSMTITITIENKSLKFEEIYVEGLGGPHPGYIGSRTETHQFTKI